MYVRGGFGLSTACDVRYEDEGGDDGPDEDVDFSNWNTWYSHVKDVPDREKIAEVLEQVAAALNGKATPHPTDKALEVSLYIPADVPLSDIRIELVDALMPFGIDVSKAMIGIENLLIRIEDKGGEVETTRIDFILPSEGYALDKRGELIERGAEPGPKGTPEKEHQAELERAREARTEDQLAELGRRQDDREAAARAEELQLQLDAANEAVRLAEEALERAREEAEALRAERPAYVPDFPPPPPPRRHRAPEPPRVEERKDLAHAAETFESEMAKEFGFVAFEAPSKPSKPAKKTSTKPASKTSKAKPTEVAKKTTKPAVKLAPVKKSAKRAPSKPAKKTSTKPAAKTSKAKPSSKPSKATKKSAPAKKATTPRARR